MMQDQPNPDAARDAGQFTTEEYTAPSMKSDSEYTKSEIVLARKLWDAANDEGTIQAGDARRILPHERPELHTTISMKDAFSRVTGKAWNNTYFMDLFS